MASKELTKDQLMEYVKKQKLKIKKLETELAAFKNDTTPSECSDSVSAISGNDSELSNKYAGALQRIQEYEEKEIFLQQELVKVSEHNGLLSQQLEGKLLLLDELNNQMKRKVGELNDLQVAYSSCQKGKLDVEMERDLLRTQCDTWKRDFNQLRSEKDHFETLYTETQGQLTLISVELKTVKTDSASEISKMKEEYSKQEANYQQQLQQLFTSLTMEIESMKEQKPREEISTEYENTILSLQATISELEIKLKNSNDSLVASSENETMYQQKIRQLEIEAVNSQREVKASEEEIKSLKASVSELESTLSAKSSVVCELESKLTDVESDLQIKASEIQKLRDSFTEKPPSDLNETAENAIDLQNEKVDSYQHEIKELQSALELKTIQIQSLQTALAERDNDQKISIVEIQSNLNTNSNEIEISELKNIIQRLTEKNESLDKIMEELQSEKVILTKQFEIQLQQLQSLNEELERRLVSSDQFCAKMKEELSIVQEAESKLRLTCAELEKEVDEKTQKLAQLEEIVQEQSKQLLINEQQRLEIHEQTHTVINSEWEMKYQELEKTYQQEITSWQSRLQDMEIQSKNADEAKTQEAQQEIDKLKKMLKKTLAQSSNKVKEMDELQELFNKKQQEYSELEKNHLALQEKCFQVSETNTKLEEKESEYETRETLWQKKYNQLNQDFHSFEKLKDTEIDELKRVQEQTLEEFEANQKKLIQNFTQEIEYLLLETSRAKETLKLQEDSMKGVSDLTSQLDQLKAQNTELEFTLSQAQENNKTLQLQYIELQQEQQQRLSTNEQTNAAINSEWEMKYQELEKTYQQEITLWQSRLQDMEIQSKNQHNAIESKDQETQQELDKLKKEMTTKDGMLKKTLMKIKNKTKEMDELQELFNKKQQEYSELEKSYLTLQEKYSQMFETNTRLEEQVRRITSNQQSEYQSREIEWQQQQEKYIKLQKDNENLLSTIEQQQKQLLELDLLQKKNQNLSSEITMLKQQQQLLITQEGKYVQLLQQHEELSRKFQDLQILYEKEQQENTTKDEVNNDRVKKLKALLAKVNSVMQEKESKLLLFENYLKRPKRFLVLNKVTVSTSVTLDASSSSNNSNSSPETWCLILPDVPPTATSSTTSSATNGSANDEPSNHILFSKKHRWIEESVVEEWLAQGSSLIGNMPINLIENWQNKYLSLQESSKHQYQSLQDQYNELQQQFSVYKQRAQSALKRLGNLDENDKNHLKQELEMKINELNELQQSFENIQYEKQQLLQEKESLFIANTEYLQKIQEFQDTVNLCHHLSQQQNEQIISLQKEIQQISLTFQEKTQEKEGIIQELSLLVQNLKSNISQSGHSDSTIESLVQMSSSSSSSSSTTNATNTTSTLTTATNPLTSIETVTTNNNSSSAEGNAEKKQSMLTVEIDLDHYSSQQHTTQQGHHHHPPSSSSVRTSTTHRAHLLSPSTPTSTASNNNNNHNNANHHQLLIQQQVQYYYYYHYDYYDDYYYYILYIRRIVY
jgi:hypothetical protein